MSINYEISVRTLHGKQIFLEVSPEDKIEKILEGIRLILGYNPENFEEILLDHGKRLEPRELVSYYPHIQNGSELFFHLGRMSIHKE